MSDAFKWNVYKPIMAVEDTPDDFPGLLPLYLSPECQYKFYGWSVIGCNNLTDEDVDCCTWVCLFPNTEAAAFFLRGIEAANGPEHVSYLLADHNGITRCLLFWADSDPEIVLCDYTEAKSS